MGRMYSECIMCSIVLEGINTLKARNHVHLFGCKSECRKEVMDECKYPWMHTYTLKKRIKCQPEQTHCRYDSVCLSLHVRGLIYTWAWLRVSGWRGAQQCLNARLTSPAQRYIIHELMLTCALTPARTNRAWTETLIICTQYTQKIYRMMRTG